MLMAPGGFRGLHCRPVPNMPRRPRQEAMSRLWAGWQPHMNRPLMLKQGPLVYDNCHFCHL